MVKKWRSRASIMVFASCWTLATATGAETNAVRILAGGEYYQGAPIMTLSAD